ncbi:MAG: glycine/betaine ABC transporter [Micrococcales bacterium]|nr:MAG: glycine/betaine ABC transporter [Micrococcales bacterium]
MSGIDSAIPRIRIGEAADRLIDWLRDNLDPVFDAVAAVLEFFVDSLTELLLWPPALAMAAVFALLGWFVRSWRFGAGVLAGMLLLVAMDVWSAAMQTLALVVVATVVTVLVAVPIGIVAARNQVVSTIVKPVLDFMQTMPAFVYLIPAVLIFSVGVVPGVVATIIFSLPPGVRLTELGIRQVDAETVEAGEAFGATPQQILRGIQIPLATPTIMAGINQVIMLALSMAVIAGMVGADGLGKLVVSAIAQLNTPLGVEAGLGVVILAIFLDRLTAALGDPAGQKGSLRARLAGDKQRGLAQVT